MSRHEAFRFRQPFGHCGHFIGMHGPHRFCFEMTLRRKSCVSEPTYFAQSFFRERCIVFGAFLFSTDHLDTHKEPNHDDPNRDDE